MTQVDSAKHFIGVDVGGTNIKLGVVDDAGESVWFSSIPTSHEQGPADAVQRIGSAFDQAFSNNEIHREKIVAAGLGTPGTMDIPAGMLLHPPNLPSWSQFPIRDALAKRLGMEITFTNDANAAACGEFWIGAAKDYQSLVLLTLGTGVGGGIIVKGRTIEGFNSHGAEVGHLIVDTSPDALTCSCGRPGHLEGYASATAIAARATTLAKGNSPTSLTSLLQANGQLTALDVCQQAEQGDEASLKLIDETADFLAVGCADLAHTIDPQAIVLGGAMNFGGFESPVGSRFIERVRHETLRRVFPTMAQRLKIEFASLGGKAGYIGAAALARTRYHRHQNTPAS